jgi:hypothetical protein
MDEAAAMFSAAVAACHGRRANGKVGPQKRIVGRWASSGLLLRAAQRGGFVPEPVALCVPKSVADASRGCLSACVRGDNQDERGASIWMRMGRG